MKRRSLRKLLSMILAVVMMLGVCGTAMADDEPTNTTYSITINNKTDGYTYKVYQIFTGDLTTDDDGNLILTDIEWGSSVSSSVKTKLLGEYSAADAAELAEKIAEDGDAQSLAELLADYIDVTGGLTEVDTLSYDDEKENYSLSGLAAGYYLIVNTGVPESGDEIAYSNYIVKVVNDVNMSPKSDVPTSHKTVDDVNDSTGATSENGTSADYDIGDDVPFTLTATLPSYYADYTTYSLTFHDTMSPGLTFDSESVVVKIDDITIDDSYYSVNSSTDENTGETIITIAISDLKTIEADGLEISKDSSVVVTYNAELNNNAVIGGEGNPNTMYIEYSNNPNGSSTGTTPEETVVVYTYKLTVYKVDESERPLEGAAFTLYKYNPTTEEYEKVGGEVTAEYQIADISSEFVEGVTYYTCVDSGETKTYTKVGTTDAFDSNITYYVKNLFTFTGLDDGSYMLSETTTPDGYNSLEDIYFAITAEHDVDGTVVTVNDESGTINVSEDGYSMSATIMNVSGSTLPSTGGIGTTIFYIIGGILVSGAAVLLITKKRLDKME